MQDHQDSFLDDIRGFNIEGWNYLDKNCMISSKIYKVCLRSDREQAAESLLFHLFMIIITVILIIAAEVTSMMNKRKQTVTKRTESSP